MDSAHSTSAVQQSQEADVIVGKIAELSLALEEHNPDIAQYVKQIHGNLLQYPELVHILTPTQVLTVVKGIQQVNGTQIAEAAKPKVRTTKTKEAKVPIGDLLSSLGL